MYTSVNEFKTGMITPLDTRSGADTDKNVNTSAPAIIKNNGEPNHGEVEAAKINFPMMCQCEISI